MAAADGTKTLHDSRLSDGRLLAKLFDVGVVMLDDAQYCCHASRAACELLGAESVDALRGRWDTVGAELGIADLRQLEEDAVPLQRRVEIRTPAGTRELRLEAHAIRDDGRARYVVLLRDRVRPDRADRALVRVAQALANRHLLTGLVHDAKGPLNNVKLTLALLSSDMARAESAGLPAPDTARWRRHLDTLLMETGRLDDSLRRIDAITRPGDGSSDEFVDARDALREVTGALHHEAMMREVTMALEAPASAAWILADARQLRCALLGFTVCMLDVTQPGGTIVWSVRVAEPDILLHVAATPSKLPDGLMREFFRVTGTGESDYAAAIAGRVIIEAGGGEVTLETGSNQSGFAIRMCSPSHPAS